MNLGDIMDQEKIGKFIQKLRKEKELTQQELANKLNVTDRAVSKWETGRGLPDLSIIKTLCEENSCHDAGEVFLVESDCKFTRPLIKRFCSDM